MYKALFIGMTLVLTPERTDRVELDIAIGSLRESFGGRKLPKPAVGDCGLWQTVQRSRKIRKEYGNLIRVGGARRDLASEALMRFLREESLHEVVEALGLEALGLLGDSRVASFVESKVHAGEDGLIRMHAIRALAAMNHRPFSTKLIPLLKDRDKSVRKEAASALGVLGSKEHRAALVPLLNDRSTPVAREAALSLGALSGHDWRKEKNPVKKARAFWASKEKQGGT